MVDIKTNNPLILRPQSLPTSKKGKGSDKVEEISRRSPKARLNFIPSTDELAIMIDKALTALSKGIFWDRGSIINIVL